jgi:hypothetical protein
MTGTEILKTLSEYGLTLSQFINSAITIIVAFFSARWGGAETRKQFQIKTENDKKVAAAKLIPLLIRFASECDEKRENLSLYISSQGHDGKNEPMRGTKLDPRIQEISARLGPQVAGKAIKLEVLKDRAERYIYEAAGFVDEDDLDQSIISFLALLSLRARTLVDMAASEAKLAMSHPASDLDRLTTHALRHASAIDSGNETMWY